MAQFEKLTAPTKGTPIRFENGQPVVADNPIIPFIRGDGTGVDIWPATQKVLDAAVAKAYTGTKTIEWFKVYAGDEACDRYGTYQYLPEDTLEANRRSLCGGCELLELSHGWVAAGRHHVVASL